MPFNKLKGDGHLKFLFPGCYIGVLHLSSLLDLMQGTHRPRNNYNMVDNT